MGDHGETKVCDLRVACGVYKDARLAGRQYSGKIIFRIITHSLKVSVNHIARMEVAKTFSHIR